MPTLQNTQQQQKWEQNPRPQVERYVLRTTGHMEIKKPEVVQRELYPELR